MAEKKDTFYVIAVNNLGLFASQAGTVVKKTEKKKNTSIYSNTNYRREIIIVHQLAWNIVYFNFML